MSIYICRHGETTGDVEEIYGGDYNDSLTEKGVREAKQLAKKLEGKGIEIIYCSPKARATETAKIIADELKVSSFAMENLRERNNYGVLTGIGKKDAAEKFPGEVKKLEIGSPAHGIEGSENYKTFAERVMRAFNAVINEQNENVLIVTHAGPIKIIVSALTQNNLDNVGHCALIELEKSGEEYKIISLENVEITK
ncbi:MAG: histidine phosphatase family protein [archaeon]|jgi:broad specificity phosphatase PhoE